MITSGRRIRSGERERASCSYCGAVYDRRDLVREPGGLLRCPSEGSGRDAITLTRDSVATAEAWAQRKASEPHDPGPIGKEHVLTAEEELQAWEPSGVRGYVLNLNPYSMVTLSADGAGVSCITSIVGKNNFPFFGASASEMPAWEPEGWVAASSGIKRPSMLFDGIDDCLACVNGVAQILTGGTNAPSTIFCVAQMIAVPSDKQNTIFSTGDISITSGTRQIFCAVNVTWTAIKSPVFVSGGVADTAKHYFDVNQAGQSVTVGVDGATVATGAQVSPYLSVAAMTLGRNARSATNLPSVHGNVRIARLLGFTSSLGASDMALVRGKLAEIYF